MASDVFISHANDDRCVAEAVSAALEARGLDCWLASRDLLPGQDASAAIPKAKLLLAILSPASAEAPQFRHETERAAEHRLPVLFFRIAEVEPPVLPDGSDMLDALLPPLTPHLDYLGDRAVRLLQGAGSAAGRQLTQPPRPFHPRRGSAAWLPIAMAGAAGVGAIALASLLVQP